MGSMEIRGKTRPDLHATIHEAAQFIGQNVWQFCLTASIEKAREILMHKEEYQKVIKQ